LVNLQTNSPGGAPEALYVGSLVVPAGATLDLNGLKVYALDVQIAGTVIGGTVERVVPALPFLQIRLLGPSVEVSWSISAGAFTLETAESLADPAQWRTVTDAPVLVGPNNTVTQPVVGAARFYRLHN